MSRSGEGGRARGRGGWAKDSFKIQDAVKTKMQFKGLESSLLPPPECSEEAMRREETVVFCF